jgi:hypothetical protein
MKSQFAHFYSQLRPDPNVCFYIEPSRFVQIFFRNKDPLTKHMHSNIVYNVKYNDCSQSYIGKTERQAIGRMREHRAPKDGFDHSSSIKNDDDDDTNNSKAGSRSRKKLKLDPSTTARLRRSSSIRNKTTTLNTTNIVTNVVTATTTNYYG